MEPGVVEKLPRRSFWKSHITTCLIVRDRVESGCELQQHQIAAPRALERWAAVELERVLKIGEGEHIAAYINRHAVAVVGGDRADLNRPEVLEPRAERDHDAVLAAVAHHRLTAGLKDVLK